MSNFNDEDLKKERKFLKKVSKTYRESPYLKMKQEFIMKTFYPYLIKNHSSSNSGLGLQLGCSNGYETEMLSKILYKLDVIEGSSLFIERCKKKKPPNVRFIYSLFEEFKILNEDEKYDYVICTYVLEHVINVELILNMIKSVLKPNGLLFIVVPNCRALSRQLALNMNIILDLRGLTENDRNHGHRRVYDRISLNREIEKCGFHIIQQGGIIFKILADFQLDKLLEDSFLNKSHFEGLYNLGLEYPDFSDSLYAICYIKD